MKARSTNKKDSYKNSIFESLYEYIISLYLLVELERIVTVFRHNLSVKRTSNIY